MGGAPRLTGASSTLRYQKSTHVLRGAPRLYGAAGRQQSTRFDFQHRPKRAPLPLKDGIWSDWRLKRPLKLSLMLLWLFCVQDISHGVCVNFVLLQGKTIFLTATEIQNKNLTCSVGNWIFPEGRRPSFEPQEAPVETAHQMCVCVCVWMNNLTLCSNCKPH